jgi:hypothetical protein
MLLELGRCRAPAPNRVTVLAARSELAPVNVGMTLCALDRGRSKFQSDVATAAWNVVVQCPEWIFCLRIMIELRNRTYRTPCRRRVTVLAGNSHRAVRICSPAANGLLSSRSRNERGRQQ